MIKSEAMDSFRKKYGGSRAKGVTPETRLKRAIRSYLSIRGWYSFPILQGMGAHKGIADIFAIKAGRGIWIEAKAPGGRISEHQLFFKLQVEAYGGEYVLARSIEDLEARGI